VVSEKDGVVTWNVKPGDEIIAGQTIGYITDIEDPDTPRIKVISRATGILFGLKRHHLVRPGQVIAKISGILTKLTLSIELCSSLNVISVGTDPLPWRLDGDLLTV
jgi:hypothetical protein